MDNQLSYSKFKGGSENLLLIHGFCESKAMWYSIIPALQKRFTIYCVDLPGFGGTEPMAEFNIIQLAKTIHAFQQSVIKDNYFLAGHSLGGYVAIELCRLSNQINGLALIHTTTEADSNLRKRIRAMAMDKIKRYGAESYIKGFFQPLFAAQNLNRCAADIAKLQNTGLGINASVLMDTQQAMMNRRDNTEVLKGLSFPILFYSGRHDALIPFGSQLQQVLLCQQVRWIIDEESGHMAMFENPGGLATAICSI